MVQCRFYVIENINVSGIDFVKIQSKRTQGFWITEMFTHFWCLCTGHDWCHSTLPATHRVFLYGCILIHVLLIILPCTLTLLYDQFKYWTCSICEFAANKKWGFVCSQHFGEKVEKVLTVWFTLPCFLKYLSTVWFLFVFT